MTRIDYLTELATQKRLYRDGRIDIDTYVRRLVDIVHRFAGVADTSGFHRHVDQALEVVQ